MAIIRAENLVKSYEGTKAVNGISLNVSSGEVVGLLGPNGAGKTTCFYIIMGTIKQDHGEMLLDSQNISNLPVHSRGRIGIGYLPQEPSIFKKLSALDNILSVLERRKDLKKMEAQKKARQLIEDFKLESISEHLGGSLSGGERRRVEIARALANDPKFILLDEPFAGVDPISVEELKEIISSLARRRIGVLITDHNVRETLDICDKAYIVNKGKIIAQGDPSAILENNEVKKVYLGSNFRM
ncbi:LPS export ABC transporter ATP-binding protein [Gammaproteobacteria bacterium]|nr:LPS export ABC transporter ATP-binding protein [Gammaproteobacteria bacterium]